MNILSEVILRCSELNRLEKFRLECAVSSQYNEAYNCRACLKVNEKNPESNRVMRVTKGCFGKTKIPVAVMDDETTKVFMCPGRLYTYREVMLIDDYKRFLKHGILPEEGHINNQDSKVIEAFMFIESEIAKNEEILRKKKDVERNNSGTVPQAR